MNNKPSPRKQIGLSLVELMVSLALGLLVVGAAISMLLSNKVMYSTSTALSEVQENSRTAFEMIARDLRQSRLLGCGPQNTLTNNVSSNTTAANWFANYANNQLIGYDGTTADSNPALTTGTASSNHVTGTDNLILIGASDASYSLNSIYDDTVGLDILESNPALSAGDIVVICNPSKADIVQITSVSSGKFLLETTGGTPGNASVPTNNSHNLNSMVSQLKAVSWYIGCNTVTTTPACDPDQGGTSLYRVNAVGSSGTASMITPSEEMIRGVAELEIKFHKPGDASFSEAAAVTSWAPADVDAVRIGLRAVARDNRGASAQMISRSFSTIVSLRNPPLP
jgi:type IV pilus assembly protein PilW